MRLLSDTPHFSLLHDPLGNCLQATWQGRHDGAFTQTQYELILEHVRQTHSQKLLNDCTYDENGWQAIISWLAADYFQDLATSGIMAVAWVLPHNLQALLDTRNTIALMQQPLVSTFADVEEAYAWLQKWPTQKRQES